VARTTRERSELGEALARYKMAFIAVAALSALLNVLLLGGSIYLMLIYDSVLPSQSMPTLFGLFGMVLAVYIFQGIFDTMRSRILSDVGSALDRRLAPRVQHAMGELAIRGNKAAGDGLTPMRDLDSIRGFLAGAGPAALIDLPWIVFFIAVLGFLHYWLAITALVGAIIMLGLTLVTDRITRKQVRRATQVTAYRNGLAETNVRHVELLTALGMRGRLNGKWEQINQEYLAANTDLSRDVGLFGGISKVFRMFLQSAILTVGALLVIAGEASGGVIFAASILSGRALAPVDQAIGNWRGFTAARTGWTRLKELLALVPPTEEAGVSLPRPSRMVEVQQLFVGPPGSQRITASGVDFRLEAGEALGIIGPSAAGKTSLARALLGLWQPARGTIRLDGATLDQWEPEQRGSFLGYLPQTVELLEGTVAENIARFDPQATSEGVIAASQAAGVHDMIVQLPQGYDTPVGAEGKELSAGQRQRIGLARALYGDPFLVLLDEPNSNLDAPGELALDQAIVRIRQRKGIVIVIAHRPSVLAHVSHVLFMRDGKAELFGPRDEVLAKVTNNTNVRAKVREQPANDAVPARA
jgi:ATP-binding cassette subfamily C protein